ncbi:MAG: NTP transferase domain-containing protein, partial [Eggerthellaceae bacterium]|nr:NTP transferase domain-containing protein [Eggerthellaceae bacterium]
MPIIRWVINAAKWAGITDIITVVGHGKDQVIPLVENDTTVVEQKNLAGTADAVMACKDLLDTMDGPVLILSGDSPLITPETLTALADAQRETNAAVVMLTTEFDDPFGYGRILRDEEGEVLRIIEQK